jgi:ABC-type uncharacterized transport system ATPase subunit
LFSIPDIKIEVIADWPEDHMHFFSLLSHGDKAIAKIIVAVMARPQIPIVPDNPHNALSDAQALKKAWETQWPKK